MIASTESLPLHLYQWGERGQTPILMLHGHPGGGRCMHVFAEAIRDQFWAIAPDLRGYGSSRAPASFQLQDHLSDLDALLERLSLDRFLVLGWSLGGILALELALRHRQRVQGLILIASAARPVGNHPPVDVWDEINTGIASVLNWIWPGWEWVIATWGRRSLYRYLIQHHTPEAYRYLARFALPAYLQTSTHAQHALRAALRERYDRTSDLNTLDMPALVMAGEQDCHITCAASQETAQALPRATWIPYLGTAHLFPWEIPGQVQQDLKQWLSNHHWVGSHPNEPVF